MKKFLKNPKKFMIKLDEDDHQKLRELSYRLGLPMAGVIRRYIHYGFTYLDDNQFYFKKATDEKPHLD